MNYSNLLMTDVANGLGLRTSLFVSGCRRHCKNCFNPDTWDFNFGEKFTNDVETEILESMALPYIDGLTILGGEPLELENQPDVTKLVKDIKTEYPDKTIWIYTGFTYEDLMASDSSYVPEILKNIDVLVDGAFDDTLYDMRLNYRGSSNQRLIDIPATLQQGIVITLDL